ncbi:porin family protein [Fibrella arboris]|uniref:porin family protein n=1 Tax=Fibrella arboris TaxID=3242486 RepID=UPI00352085A4
MKNSYTLLFLLTTSTLLAQTPTRPQVYVRAGVGTSLVNSTGQGVVMLSQQFQYETDLLLTGTGNALSLMTPTVGAGFSIDMNKHFTIGAELNVEQKGARATTDRLVTYCTGGNCGIVYHPPTSIPAVGQATTRLTYLTLPILASYRLGKISLLGGPCLNLKLAERQKGNYQFLVNNAYNSITYFDMQSSQFNTFHFGLITGLAYALTHRFRVDLRYSRSLARSASSNNVPLPSLSQTAQVSLRYTINDWP